MLLFPYQIGTSQYYFIKLSSPMLKNEEDKFSLILANHVARKTRATVRKTLNYHEVITGDMFIELVNRIPENRWVRIVSVYPQKHC